MVREKRRGRHSAGMMREPQSETSAACLEAPGVIEVCFIADAAYVLPTAVAIESLKANRRHGSRCRIHVVCRDVPPKDVAMLEGLSTPEVEVHAVCGAVLPVGEARLSLVRHVSLAALFKFFLPALLPDLSRVVYIDSDVLVLDDLSPLWETCLDGVYAGVVKDSQSVVGWDNHLKWLGFRHEAYFNSGVMLLNLDLMRRDGIPARLMDYRIRGRNRFMDQDALNVVFGDRVKYLPMRWNCLNWLFNSCTIPQLKALFGEDQVADTPEENFDRAAILHIGGSEKPWLRDLPYYTPLYRKYADRIGWKFWFPKVSVVVPVFNAAAYLRQCLESILSQTIRQIEAVCVDNGSTDGSMEILEEFAAKDPRVRVFRVGKRGAGRCRNFGISRARGEFIGFVDSDDFISPDFFGSLYRRAKEDGADVSMTADVRLCSPDGKPGALKEMGVKGRTVIVKVKERCDLMLASGVTWNKLYSSAFLAQSGAHFDELPCAGEDKVFDYCVMFHANRIAVASAGATYWYRQAGPGSASFRRKGRESFAIIGFWREVKEMLDARAMSPEAKASWRDTIKRARDAEFRAFLRRMDPKFRPEFAGLCAEAFYDDAASVRTIPGLVVSLTSYPARIDTVGRTIKSILGQSVRPERTILWLASSQFPGKEKNLPADLLDLQHHGLEIRWCEDIRSYKKLVPSLALLPGKCIVTADDDLLYPRYWLEKLWQEHLENPSDIIAHRLRRMERKGGRFLPYKTWPIVTHSVRTEPYLTLPTTGGGVLYPPGCFTPDVSRSRVFMKVAPHADDIWFWAMAVLARRRIRQVYSYEADLFFVEGTQATTLATDNVAGGGNDRQLKAVLARYPSIGAFLRSEERRRRLKGIVAAVCGLPACVVSGVANLALLFAPYGLAARVAARRGHAIDMPLMYWPGTAKRARRILKFMLPCAVVRLFQVARYGRKRLRKMPVGVNGRTAP